MFRAHSRFFAIARRALLRPTAIVLALVASLAGCAAGPTAQADRSLQVINAEDGGTIVGSIGARPVALFKTEGSPYTSHTIYFRKVGSKKGGTLEFAPPNPPFRVYTPDFQDEQVKANLFKLTLPAGEYELYSVSFYYNNGTSESTFTPKAEFSIPFTVEKGKVTYLGSLTARGIWGRNFLRMPVPAGGYFVVEDRRTRDLPLIQSRLSGPATPQVKLLEPAQGIPFVRAAVPG
jgi:hypothetical protein